MATRYAELVGRLERLSKPANVFAGFGVSDALTEAAAAITALERVETASRTYFDRYCQDEAEDVENCVCGDQQHHDAIALRDALASIESKQ